MPLADHTRQVQRRAMSGALSGLAEMLPHAHCGKHHGRAMPLRYVHILRSCHAWRRLSADAVQVRSVSLARGRPAAACSDSRHRTRRQAPLRRPDRTRARMRAGSARHAACTCGHLPRAHCSHNPVTAVLAHAPCTLGRGGAPTGCDELDVVNATEANATVCVPSGVPTTPISADDHDTFRQCLADGTLSTEPRCREATFRVFDATGCREACAEQLGALDERRVKFCKDVTASDVCFATPAPCPDGGGAAPAPAPAAPPLLLDPELLGDGADPIPPCECTSCTAKRRHSCRPRSSSAVCSHC